MAKTIVDAKPISASPSISKPCRRLCTANDHDALIEHVAEQLWESRRHGTLDDWPWADAGGYWQPIYRELAETAVESISRPN